MDWRCPPVDFKRLLQEAAATADLESRLGKLRSIAECRLSYLETIQVDRVLLSSSTGKSSLPRARLALLGSSTVEHLIPSIRVACLGRGLLVDVHGGRYGLYRQDLLEIDSPVCEFRPDLILLALSCREVVAGVPVDATRESVDRALSSAINEVRALWQRARERFGAAVIQQSYLDVTEELFGNHDRLIPSAPTNLVLHLNERLADAAAEDSVLFLDVARASAKDGLDAWFDLTRWLQGKMEVAPHAAGRYGERLARLVGAQYGRSRKCLALDLDNTLWGGVIGDDGIDGIVLGQGSGLGEAYLALQRYAKQLKDRGVVLAVCSKNDPEIAAAAFDHPEMHLRRSDFAAFVANWSDKAANLELIAERLNLGLDSLVFVDDNPAERARVRESLPKVAVPEMPADPTYYVRCLEQAGYFEAVAFTSEDRNRASQYTANVEREALRGSSASLEDFLRGLNMSAVCGRVGPMEVTRAAQLINKTNQFNTTTRRITLEELKALASAPENLVLKFKLEDRFGDNGLVSVMLLCPDSADSGTLELRNWVMSCRVFGRQLEQEAMNFAVELARERGVRMFRGDYIPTAKNGVIEHLFAGLGFSRIGEQSGGGSRWELDLAGYEPKSTHIDRKAEADDRSRAAGSFHEHTT